MRWALSVALVLFAFGLTVYCLLPAVVQVMYGVEPGGRDVVVTDNGRRISPYLVSPESNLYSYNVLPGKHHIVIQKPGFKPRTRTLVLRWGSGEAYPVFPPLEPLPPESRADGPKK